ncbi:MAG: NADPH:quinone oxidoreductase family protein [Hyphomicrobiaceae bacterium]
MRAAVCQTLEGPGKVVVADLPAPVPGKGEVLVRVKAVALNFLDTLITRGKYQYKPDLPFSPAAEIAGVVESVGEGEERLRVGQRVCGYIGWGGARELVAAKADLLVEIPDGVSDEVAAGTSVTYGTAIHGLKDRGVLKGGETLAVLGASGGAGLAAVELGKLMGARVIAVASTQEKLDLCVAHGADAGLNYATTDLKQGLRGLTDGRGVDVIYDCVGGDYAEAALRSIAWGGRFLVVGFAAGQIPRIPLNLMLLKSCGVLGVFWGEMVMRAPHVQRANLEQILQWISEGKLRPHIHKVYPLEQTGEAIASLETRTVTGKVIVAI